MADSVSEYESVRHIFSQLFITSKPHFIICLYDLELIYYAYADVASGEIPIRSVSLIYRYPSIVARFEVIKYGRTKVALQTIHYVAERKILIHQYSFV